MQGLFLWLNKAYVKGVLRNSSANHFKSLTFLPTLWRM